MMWFTIRKAIGLASWTAGHRGQTLLHGMGLQFTPFWKSSYCTAITCIFFHSCWEFVVSEGTYITFVILMRVTYFFFVSWVEPPPSGLLRTCCFSRRLGVAQQLWWCAGGASLQNWRFAVLCQVRFWCQAHCICCLPFRLLSQKP